MALLRAGARDKAVAILRRAGETYQRLGATAGTRRIRTALAGAGVRPVLGSRSTSRPATGWDALTRTERRVALLVAEGHTNRSAAETLTLSPSTVATHLRSIFTKLSLASRMELTRLVRAQPGTAGSSPATPK
ncbi:response regulator transcription factor [Streptomyces sp. NPDC002758]